MLEALSLSFYTLYIYMPFEDTEQKVKEGAHPKLPLTLFSHHSRIYHVLI